MVQIENWQICEQGWRKGPWTPEEDKLLIQYVTQNGEGRWSCVSQSTGLNRNAKSCRLRWVNYLRPGLKKGEITPQEEGIIIELHALWGNKWSTIAGYLPGRTDNEIKNYWRTHFKKRKPTDANQENRKSIALKRQKTEQEDCSSIEASPQTTETQSSDEQNCNQEADIVYPSIDDQEFFHMIYQDTTSLWSDFNTIDNYLSDELWNFSDQNGCINIDATNYNQNGGYMY